MGLHRDAQKAELEALETRYAELTGGDALITDETDVTKRYTLADGGTATGMDDAIKSGRALVRFVENQKKG
jgi:hypothetical protein